MNNQHSQRLRNHEIEFWRFIFAVMVFLCHMRVLPYGSLAVDFFFLLTGYLTMLSIQNARQNSTAPKTTFRFIIHKIKSFYPELLVSSFFSVLIVLCTSEINSEVISGAVKTIMNGIIPLKMTGIGISVRDFNGATWYLSSMIIGLIIVYPLLVKHGTHPILFILGVMICGYLCVSHGQLGYVYTYIGFTFEGNLRAVGELCIGATMYQAIQAIHANSLTHKGAILATILKYGCIGIIIVISMLNNTNHHGIALCAAILAIILIFSEKGIDYPLYNNRFCLFLGRLSLPLYLQHIVITTFPFCCSAGYAFFSIPA